MQHPNILTQSSNPNHSRDGNKQLVEFVHCHLCYTRQICYWNWWC